MNWNKHFSKDSEVLWPINDAPVEAVIKVVTYHLRARYGNDWSRLKFLEVGCGGGANLAWLAGRGIRIAGIDVSESAIAATKKRLESLGLMHQVYVVEEGIAQAPNFADEQFDGVIEACVFQHLDKEKRARAFSEVSRMLKPGGIFVGYCLSADDDIYLLNTTKQLEDDPGTVILSNGPLGHLQNIGLTHFFRKDEFKALLPKFEVECLNVTYTVPEAEAKRRGMKLAYKNCFYVVYGVKE